MNKYFDNLYNKSEQDLFSDLVKESIEIHGSSVLYIVRDLEGFDDLLREEKLSVFKTTYKVDAYVQGSDNSAMQKYMSNFGYRFEQTTEVIIATLTWDAIGSGFNQPREGDYIYIGNPNDTNRSFVNCMFQIDQVSAGTPEVNQFGGTHAYKLSLSTVNKSYSKVLDTPYTDINDILNPTPEKDNLTTIKKPADDFADVNVFPISNSFNKWGIK